MNQIVLTSQEIRTILKKGETDKYKVVKNGVAYNKNWFKQKFLLIKRKKDGQKFINVNKFLSANDKNLKEKFYFKKNV